MDKAQYRGMQGLAAEASECGADGGGEPQDACRMAPAIDRVAEQGVAGMGHVHADLVGAAGFQPAFDQGGGPRMVEGLKHPVVGDRGAAPFGPDGHLLPVARACGRWRR